MSQVGTEKARKTTSADCPVISPRNRFRTCIATRRVQPDTSLLRVVADTDASNRVIPDPQRRLPGRGAWLTPTVEAYEIAEKRQAFRRALRMKRNPDSSPVREYISRAQAAPAGINNRESSADRGMTTTRKDPSN